LVRERTNDQRAALRRVFWEISTRKRVLGRALEEAGYRAISADYVPLGYTGQYPKKQAPQPVESAS